MMHLFTGPSLFAYYQKKISCDVIHFLFKNFSEIPYSSRDISTGVYEQNERFIFSKLYSEQLLFNSAI
mgnify:CR=1 FL=1